MLTLYTAIGHLTFKKTTSGKPIALVINNDQEYGLSEYELVLWSCLAFQILQIHELKAAYNKRLPTKETTTPLPFSHYLNRLLLRGLITKGEGMTGVDALYRLLGELYITPIDNPFLPRLFTCIGLYLKGKIQRNDFPRYLKKVPVTPIEETILKLSRTVSLSTAELLGCMEQGKKPKNDGDVWAFLYQNPADTYRTLSDQAQLCHIQYPVLQAIGNLYLNQQISFEKY